MNRRKLIVTALAASAMLALAVGTAHAGWLSISEREFDVRWREMIFANNVNSATLRCAMTLLGTFHSSTIRKIRGLLGGAIDHVVLAPEPNATPATRTPCTGGAVTILTETLPWHLRYDSFSGALPRITLLKVQLINASFRSFLSTDGVTCLTRTDAAEPARANIVANETTGQLVTVTPEGEIRADDATCTFVGVRGLFTGLGTPENRHGRLIFIRLI
jgi:hypothetical protein